MKKLSVGVVLLVVLSIGFALIPAVSAEDSDGDTIPDAKEVILKTNPNLWTNTDGMVYTEASVYPGLINPGETTTVTLRAIANITAEKGEVDVVLVTDLSGSMGSGSGSKMEVAKDALETFVALADDKMHIGLASFSNAPQLYSDATWEKWLNNNALPFHPYEDYNDKSKDSPETYQSHSSNAYSDAHIDTSFTQNKTNLNSVINSYAAKGGTNIAGGINAAKKMLNESGNPDHLQVIVVMSDGIATMAPIELGSLDAYMPSDWESSDRSETGRIAAKEAANVVKQDGVIVYAIGFGSGADEMTLEDVASTGNYYFAPNNTMLAEIYSEISGEIEKITGARAYHVLPVDVDYVSGSASAEPIVNGKTLEWNIGDLAPDAPWDVSFDVKLLNAGTQPVNVVPDSKVTYIYDSTQRNVPFPEVVVVDDNLPPVAVAKARRNVTDEWQYELTVPQYEPVMFDGSESYDPDGYIVNYSWHFGDGNKSTLAGPLHVYWECGTYTVRLIVEDNRGKCEDSLTITVTPNADFNNSYANKSSNFNVREGDAYDTTTGKPVSDIGNPVNIFVNTTNSSVIYSVFVDGYKIATGNASEIGNLSWISMSSGKHEIKVRADVGCYKLEWVIDVVNVWIKPVGD